MTPEHLQMLAKARDRADELLGGVADSTREMFALELVTWWIQGGTAALRAEVERKQAQASPTKGVIRESGPESYRR